MSELKIDPKSPPLGLTIDTGQPPRAQGDTPVSPERDALRDYVQHKGGCPQRNPGQRFEKRHLYSDGRWWGAWVDRGPKDPPADPCTCGLDAALTTPPVAGSTEGKPDDAVGCRVCGAVVKRRDAWDAGGWLVCGGCAGPKAKPVWTVTPPAEAAPAGPGDEGPELARLRTAIRAVRDDLAKGDPPEVHWRVAALDEALRVLATPPGAAPEPSEREG